MKTRLTHLALALALGAVLVLAQGPLTPPGAPAPTMKTLEQIEPRTPISSLPFTISAPGSYYLTGNLTAGNSGGITIQASGVTLDLMGFELVGGSGPGIRALSVSNVCIRNGTVRGWSGSGVQLSGETDASIGCRLENLHASGNGSTDLDSGIVAHAVTVENCTASDNNCGGIGAGPGSTIRGSIARANRLDGIAGREATIVDCSAYQNERAGIDTTRCVVRSSTAWDNDGDGIVASLAGGAVSDCSVGFNGGAGILAGPGSSVLACAAYFNFGRGISAGPGSTVKDCTARENRTQGIVSGEESSVLHCNASGNQSHGIEVENRNLVVGCTANGNLLTGIQAGNDCHIRDCLAGSNDSYGISTGDHARIEQCQLQNNAFGGIRVTAFSRLSENQCDSHLKTQNTPGIRVTGSNNTLEANLLTRNGRGMEVVSTNNFIVRNTASGNNTNYIIAAVNKVGVIISAPTSGAISGSTGGAGVGTTDPWANFSF